MIGQDHEGSIYKKTPYAVPGAGCDSGWSVEASERAANHFYEQLAKPWETCIYCWMLTKKKLDGVLDLYVAWDKIN